MSAPEEIPNCIGIIMDGNRRWAKTQGLPSFEGHRRGYQTMKDVVGWADEVGVGTVIVFAFSQENWNRSKEEVIFMLDLIRWVLKDQVKEAMEKNICLRFIGDIDKFPEDIALDMRKNEKESEHNTGLILAIAVSYGGRDEIVRAVNTLIKQGKQEITTVDIEASLDTHGLPDPDMIIRTSGEMRVSGFLPWQAVYSELFFTKTLWPDFSKGEFLDIVKQYTERERRMGR